MPKSVSEAISKAMGTNGKPSPVKEEESPPRPTRRSTSTQPRTSKTSTANPVKPLRLRIVIAGPEKSGKSCLIKRYCEKRFVQRHLPTIGIDYGATRIFVDKREVSVHIFDTSGAAVFADVRNEFYRDAHGVILAYDLTSPTDWAWPTVSSKVKGQLG